MKPPRRSVTVYVDEVNNIQAQWTGIQDGMEVVRLLSLGIQRTILFLKEEKAKQSPIIPVQGSVDQVLRRRRG